MRLRLASAGDEAGKLRAFVQRTQARAAMLVSVVPEALQWVRVELAATVPSMRIAGHDAPCPLHLDYDTPHTLGADRWVGALAAHRRFGRAVVVDCGSATTVNLVDADGTFRGGPIAPGLRAFVAGMVATTPALPPAGLDAVPAMPPRSTQAAVDCGVLLGYCGLVEKLVAAALRASSGPAQVVVTGGNADRLLSHSVLLAQHEPDLVHQGLGFLAETVAWNT
jgi:type III pantothenate kinase